MIQFVQGDALREKSEVFSTKFFDIEAVRGNIYDSNGSLLATSLPYFEVSIDPNTEALTDEVYYKHIDSLSFQLAKLFKDKTPREYKRLITRARENGSRYFVLQKNVSYPDLQKIKKFPILRRGKNRGGFIYLQTNKRERPFRYLAARTIGKINENGAKSYGLESAYDSILKGKNGQRWMQKIAGDVWRPINDENEIEPVNGYDIVSTIDINVQDVAENSLMNSLKLHGADHGCLVLMEIKTGDVKAIVNLKRISKDTVYAENFNYAIADAAVPGSTFKLPSLIAVMEDFDVSLTEEVEVGNGTCFFYGKKVSDSHPPKKEVYNVQEIFEESSNVGVTKIISKYYAADPQKYIDRLYKMNLNTPLGISIPGEGIPYIKNTEDKTWSKISLPWISYGYETRITPLQILTFYAAVANNGVMMRPQFVKEIKNKGKIIISFEPQIINPQICSDETIKKAKKMMEGVVLNGTAKSLKAADYQIAGKTGTAQMGIVNDKMTYQASFVGYFPADQPKYACIVVVSAPSGDAYYGGAVAGPVFKDVADKVYSTSIEIHKEINYKQPIFVKAIPNVKASHIDNVDKALAEIKISSKYNNGNNNSEWITIKKTDSVNISIVPNNIEASFQKGLMPDLTGLTAKDAVYLLENKGLKVKISGRGAVVNQSIKPGTVIQKNIQILLELI